MHDKCPRHMRATVFRVISPSVVADKASADASAIARFSPMDGGFSKPACFCPLDYTTSDLRGA
jgi:hypothetical protein